MEFFFLFPNKKHFKNWIFAFAIDFVHFKWDPRELFSGAKMTEKSSQKPKYGVKEKRV